MMESIPHEFRGYVSDLARKGLLFQNGCFEVSSCQSSANKNDKSISRRKFPDVREAPHNSEYGFTEPHERIQLGQSKGGQFETRTDVPNQAPGKDKYGLDDTHGGRRPAPEVEDQPRARYDAPETPEHDEYGFDDSYGGRRPAPAVGDQPRARYDAHETPEHDEYGFDDSHGGRRPAPAVGDQPSARYDAHETPEHDEYGFDDSHGGIRPAPAVEDQPRARYDAHETPEHDEYGFTKPPQRRQPGPAASGQPGAYPDDHYVPEQDVDKFTEPYSKMKSEQPSGGRLVSEPTEMGKTPRTGPSNEKLSIPPRLLFDMCREFIDRDLHNTNSITNDQLVECLKAVNVFPSMHIIENVLKDHTDKVSWFDYLDICDLCYKDVIPEPENQDKKRDDRSNDEHLLI